MHDLYREFNIGVFIIILIEVSIFIALGIWTKKKPYTAILTGLIIFTIMIIISVYNGSEAGTQGLARSLTSGVLIKLIIFVTLIKAVNDAKELQKTRI
ncbi:MAG TPA: hypothetical protein VHM26_09880, partial [Chitinophagaceae bacterium]|jgi:DNA integrity scanning protein DisA with diadenylate cyclase activity|nr:hypothetical protein [Chitinophagaceae bacterium]